MPDKKNIRTQRKAPSQRPPTPPEGHPRYPANSQRKKILTPIIWISVLMVAAALLLIALPDLPHSIALSMASLRPTQASIPEETPIEPVFLIEGAADFPTPEPNALPAPNWSFEVSSIFTKEVDFWAGSIAEWSAAYRLKPNLIATVMQIESCGNPQATSEIGYQGLFQVDPDELEVSVNLFDADNNAAAGLARLSAVYATANGDIGLTFAAYHGGPAITSSPPSEWPLSTQTYQFWASGIYEEAELGMGESPTLEDWLSAGGSELCRRAAQVLGL